jgi:hypothetical protein
MRVSGLGRVVVLTCVGVSACAGGFARGQAHQSERADSVILPSSGPIARLVEELKRNPAKPTQAADWLGLYLMDLVKGDVTLIADQPEPGLTQCGSPAWSSDGRILFDATPGTQWNLTRLKALELDAGKLKLTDLGPGNCPAPSPSGDRIMFLLNAGPVTNDEAGVWIMDPDGSERKRLGGYGRPFWSPYGHQYLVVSFGSPREVTVIDDRPGRRSGVLQVPENKVFTMPGWAGEETIVAVIGEEAPDTIALVDVANPQDAKVKKVLWKKPADRVLTLNYPTYAPRTGRCAFVGADERGVALYVIEPQAAGAPRKLEREGSDKHISGLVFSPDGRYLLYSSDRGMRK